MKRLQRPAVILCIFLALCLLPLTAGAAPAGITRNYFKFYVGEPIENGDRVTFKIYPASGSSAIESALNVESTLELSEEAAAKVLQGSGIQIKKDTENRSSASGIWMRIQGTPNKAKDDGYTKIGRASCRERVLRLV